MVESAYSSIKGESDFLAGDLHCAVEDEGGRIWSAVETLITSRYAREELFLEWWKSVAMAAALAAVEGMLEIECAQFVPSLPSSVLETRSAKEKAFFRLKKLPQATIKFDNSLEKDGMVCRFEKEPDLQKTNNENNLLSL